MRSTSKDAPIETLMVMAQTPVSIAAPNARSDPSMSAPITVPPIAMSPNATTSDILSVSKVSATLSVAGKKHSPQVTKLSSSKGSLVIHKTLQVPKANASSTPYHSSSSYISSQRSALPKSQVALDKSRHSAIVLFENSDPNLTPPRILPPPIKTSPHKTKNLLWIDHNGIPPPKHPPDPASKITVISDDSSSRGMVDLDTSELVSDVDMGGERVIYASPNASRRKALWHHLRALASSIHSPWILFGDFSATLVTLNVWDVHRLNRVRFSNISYLILDFGIWDIKDLTTHSVEAPHMFVSTEHPTFSTIRQFRYFTGWYKHEDFARMVGVSWNPSSSMTDTFLHFIHAPQEWNNKVFGYIGA
ncbi:hypothetical protein V6N13_012986 [Hibiscus sabdariffa]